MQEWVAALPASANSGDIYASLEPGRLMHMPSNWPDAARVALNLIKGLGLFCGASSKLPI
jgi:hypothetical protein